VSLSAGVRDALLSLQSLAGQARSSQQRLASGKTVNSALDSPTNFFASENLNQRAKDLNSRKDAIGEGIQLIQAAQNGISAITSLLTSMKGVGAGALATNDPAARSQLAKAYLTLRAQIDQVASDSGYGGTNLLTKDNLTLN